MKLKTYKTITENTIQDRDHLSTSSVDNALACIVFGSVIGFIACYVF